MALPSPGMCSRLCPWSFAARTAASRADCAPSELAVSRAAAPLATGLVTESRHRLHRRPRACVSNRSGHRIAAPLAQPPARTQDQAPRAAGGETLFVRPTASHCARGPRRATVRAARHCAERAEAGLVRAHPLAALPMHGGTAARRHTCGSATQ